MNTIINFLGELFRKSIFAFFITASAMMAIFFPLLLLLAIGAAAGTAEIEPKTLETKYVYGNEDSANKLLTIPLIGVIYGDSDTEGGEESLFATSMNTYGYDIKETLRKAATDTSIKAVILEINSPGGTIYGSAAISDGITEYKARTKKPVYAHVTGMAASGAYWAAVGADKIVADVGSIVGSIGVINGGFMVYNKPVALDGGLLGGGVTTEEGIESYYITSGKGKDMGNPFRKPTEEELRVLQQGADNNYNIFVSRVSENRGIDEQVIRNTIGAYIYDNDSALERRLIDATGNRESTYTALATKAGVANDYKVVSAKDRKSRLEVLLGATGLTKYIPRSESTFEKRLQAEFCVPHKPLAFYGDLAAVCAQ